MKVGGGWRGVCGGGVGGGGRGGGHTPDVTWLFESVQPLSVISLSELKRAPPACRGAGKIVPRQRNGVEACKRGGGGAVGWSQDAAGGRGAAEGRT